VGMLGVELGEHAARDVQQREGRAHGGLERATLKRAYDVHRQHGQQDQHTHGGGLVAVDVIHVPVGHGLVESLVLDVPACVGEFDESFGG